MQCADATVFITPTKGLERIYLDGAEWVPGCFYRYLRVGLGLELITITGCGNGRDM
jgi:hypothetical protein